MGSSSDDDDDKKNKRVGHQQQPPLGPPPPHYQGYPPPPPYQGYGPPPPYMYHNNYPPPPNSGYYPPPPHYVAVNPERSHGYAFIRLLLVLLIMLFISFSLMSLITWLVFGSDIPNFHVDSLTMPVVNITNSTMVAGKWIANFTVRNPNKKLEIFFDNIETNLLYKDYLLATSYVEPFELPIHERKSIVSNFENRESNKNVAAGLLVKELEDQKDNVVVVFDMAISTTTAYRSESDWKKKVSMRVLCIDLEVVFPNGLSGHGAWRGENHKDCYVWA